MKTNARKETNRRKIEVGRPPTRPFTATPSPTAAGRGMMAWWKWPLRFALVAAFAIAFVAALAIALDAALAIAFPFGPFYDEPL
jgi:hypothetical protein